MHRGTAGIVTFDGSTDLRTFEREREDSRFQQQQHHGRSSMSTRKRSHQNVKRINRAQPMYVRESKLFVRDYFLTSIPLCTRYSSVHFDPPGLSPPATPLRGSAAAVVCVRYEPTTTGQCERRRRSSQEPARQDVTPSARCIVRVSSSAPSHRARAPVDRRAKPPSGGEIRNPPPLPLPRALKEDTTNPKRALPPAKRSASG